MKQAIKDKILELYPYTDTKEIVEKYGVSIIKVYNLASYHGVKKNQEYLDNWKLSGRGQIINHGAKHRFPKGHKPHNKGRKLSEYTDQASIEKIKKTSFKKGNEPHNTKHDGAISLRCDKSGIKYYYYRVSKAKWIPYHHKIWMDANGKVPKGHIVVFKDKNSLNCKLENLEMITYAENMNRNTFQRYPNELKQTIKTIIKLKKIINGKEQN
jgi:hypothetical protein